LGNNFDGDHLVIKKVLFGGAIALSAAAGLATPAGADPSAFGTLGCSCQPPAAVPGGKAPASSQMDQGIQSGLDYLHGSPQHPANN
jgi:hypothetical protein